jgi:polyisoprenoid-binding protein YceI
MKISRFFIILICSAFVFTGGVAQMVKYEVSEGTEMTVSGTSTLHDWTSEVREVKGFVELDDGISSKGKVKKGDKIDAVEIVVTVDSIISPRGATMDKKTYNALKSKEHPKITFRMDDNKVTSLNGDVFNLLASGSLTIAGKTNEVEFPVEGKFENSNSIVFSGAYKLNMLEYDMEPPSAMFGQIQTGEEVEIKFKLVVSKQ